MKRQILTPEGAPSGATYSIENPLDTLPQPITVVFDSRGTTAGTHAYRAGMVLMLQRLAAIGCQVNRIAIDTKTTADLPLAARTLDLGGYPLNLPELASDDAGAERLRAKIHTAAARAGRAPGSKGGGNGTKRLRLWVTIDRAAVLAAAITSGLVALEAAA